MSADSPREKIRRLARERRYYLTLHAEEEMEEENISILEVEQVLVNGIIRKRQRDTVTGECKYILLGANHESPIEVVVKITETGEIVVITVYTW